MESIVELVYEFRELWARREAEPWALSIGEEQRLTALEKVLRVRGVDGGRRRHARIAALGRGLLHIGLARTDVELIDIGGSGARVSSLLPVALGQRVTLQLWSLATGYSLEFPGEVKWRSGTRMGIEFHGAPDRTLPVVSVKLHRGSECAIGW